MVNSPYIIQWVGWACIGIQGVSENRLLQIAQDPHLTVTIVENKTTPFLLYLFEAKCFT